MISELSESVIISVKRSLNKKLLANFGYAYNIQYFTKNGFMQNLPVYVPPVSLEPDMIDSISLQIWNLRQNLGWQPKELPLYLL